MEGPVERIRHRKRREGLKLLANNITSEVIQIQVVLFVAKWVLQFLRTLYQTAVDKSSQGYSRNGEPSQGVKDLERKDG